MNQTEGQITNAEPSEPEIPPENLYHHPYMANPNPPQIRILVQEPVYQRSNESGVAPMLYFASCALFFLPFGWLIALLSICWLRRLNRPLTIPEERAFRFLYVCIMVNFVLTIIFLIMTPNMR